VYGQNISEMSRMTGHSRNTIKKAIRGEPWGYKERTHHTRGKPFHPMTQGKIERYHRSMKNLILLDHYYSPSELEDQIRVFVEYYNNHRYHEALKNVTPADMYYGHDLEILERREQTKQKTILLRRKQNRTLRLAEKAGKVYMHTETFS
jgi:hypothetical protein